jgi:HTH-type transcriptional regulator / antitoxin HipB
MRLDNPGDLGLYVRDRRARLGLTQAQLCASAQVSRRWLSDLESGKPTAEVGLVFRVLHALQLMIDVRPCRTGPDTVDLDAILGELGRPTGGGRG